MERAKRWLASYRLQILMICGLFFAILIILLSPTLQECVQANNEPYANAPLAKRAGVLIWSLWWCGGIFAKENGEAITGLASIAIAIFTWTLFRATTEQGRLTQESIDVARGEFNATHRPEIIVHSAQHADGVLQGDEITICAAFAYFNKGVSPALNVQISAVIVPMAHGTVLQERITTQYVRNQPTDPIVPGRPYSFIVSSDVLRERGMSKIEEPNLDAVLDDRFPDNLFTDIKSPEADVYCVGTISYEDAAEVRRQTGFCWLWKEDRTWHRIVGNSYDYAY